MPSFENSESSPLSSLLSTVVFKSCWILLFVFSMEFSTAERDFALFSSTSFITVPNTTWSLRDTKRVTFRTCIDSGYLISMTGSLTSSSSSSSPISTPLPSSDAQKLAVILLNSSVVFVWSINGQNGSVHIGSNINNNTLYTVDLKHYVNSIWFSVSQSSLVDNIIVANTTLNRFLLDVRLSGNLTIGNGFSGCIYQGPGVNFAASGVTSEDITWDTCPLNTRQGCNSGIQDNDDCYKSPCENGGTCIDGFHNYTCQCPHNYNGTNCEIDLAATYGCMVQPCQNHGTCFNQSEPNSRKFKCICAEGYTGVTCESVIDICRTRPCVHGSCISGVNSYACNCTGSGYSGINCTEDIDECANASACGPFVREHSCYNIPGGFSCDCLPGYDGAPCKDVNECALFQCKNGGTCNDGINTFNCTCIPGYTGLTCETDIDECDSSPCSGFNINCLNLVNSYRCVCQDGYEGTPCVDIDECSQKVCMNNATCTNGPGNYSCDCLPGFTDRNCSVNINECESNTCLNNASCLDRVNDYNCSCLLGFEGKNCENNTDDCVGNQCRNQALCHDQVNGYICACQPGWTGVYCETDINECDSNPCLNGAKCQNLLNSYFCDCLTGFEGQNCSDNINDCKTQPCENEVECLDGVNDYYCNCTSEWMGKNCSEEYDACSFKPCLHGANCSTEKPSHNYTCACLPGFTGPNCGHDIDDCLNSTCLSYQQCYDGIQNYTCGCPRGFTGSQCETEINECENNPCQNNATCISGHGNYTCQCPSNTIDFRWLLGPKGLFITGYTGYNCDKDINECETYNDPPICQNQGICQNSPGSFTCYCKQAPGELSIGFLCEQARSYCDIRRPNETCQNGGTCRNLAYSGSSSPTNSIHQTSRCDCAPGFTGDFCQNDIDECESSPCHYNGTCLNLVNDYLCTCIEGITGLNCETNIDDCTPTPCLNGGACHDRINSFICNCTDTGFNGTICENNIDDCEQNSCEHGGTCVDGVTSYTCNCLPGYTSSRCDFDIPDCTPNPCAFNSSCLEKSNIYLYDKNDTRFINFSYERAAGYECDCVSGVQGENCSEDINECLSNPCYNNATCTNLINTGFRCICSKGYNGSVCETEINECNLFAPCKNRGTCLDKVADYECTCPTPEKLRRNYGGKNCTTYLQGCDGNQRCRYGDCIPKLIDEVQNLHSFDCDCYPGYTGKYCTESTDISFSGHNDYILSQVNASEFHLSLQFRTTIANTVLVVSRLSSNAYVSVELTDGKVQVRTKSNTDSRSCIINTLDTVNNTEYHQLDLVLGNNITLTLPHDHCVESNCSTRNCQAALTFIGSQPRPAFQVSIGSGTVADFPGETFPASYVGCMEDVIINDVLYYPGKQIGQYFGVSPGCARTLQCLSNVCNGKGFCEDLWDSYECQCYRPSYGVKCENEYQPATFGLNPGTYAIYRNLAAAGNIDFSFFIITTQNNGFVLYFGNAEFNTQRRHAFVGLYINGSRLVGDFFMCGYAKHFDTTWLVSDGQKHFISVNIKNTSFQVLFNSEMIFENISAVAGLCGVGIDFTVTTVQIGKVISATIRGKRDVDWIEDRDITEISELSLYRHKRQVNDSSLLLSEYQSQPGFQGVIQDVRVNSRILSFDDDNFKTPDDSSNLTVGAQSTASRCQDNPCTNGGNCTEEFYNDFQCTCPQGFIGKNCNQTDYCVSGTCPSTSTCHNLEQGYECISTAAFITDGSIVTYKINGTLPKPFLTFDFRTRGLYGLIFLLRNGDNFFKVRVAKGILEINWKLSSSFSVSALTRLNRRVDNGQWYQAKFEFINETNIKLQVLQDNILLDDTDTVNLASFNFSVEDMLKQGEIILGGSDRDKFSAQWEAGYKGCLREVRLGDRLMPFFRDSAFQNNAAPNRILAQRIENIVDNCDGRNACIGHSCLNGGTCVDLWNDYECQCPTGLEGRLCEVNPDSCLSNPCQNGGVCVDGLASFTCTCPKGFSGTRCQSSHDPCEANNLCENNSTCIKWGYDFKCKCTNLEYTGWYCNVSINQSCSSSLCHNGGNCTDITITKGTNTSVPSFNCTCPPGFEGELCEKEIDYCSFGGTVKCANNGTCVNQPYSQNYSCDCAITLDYTGANCSERINDCSNSTCKNDTCIDGFRNSTCECAAGYTGSNCESKVLDICQNKSLCQHGRCEDGYCNCTGSGWDGEGCTENVNECNSTILVCLHGGECTNLEGNFSCSCALGYDGQHCETPYCTGICNTGSTCKINSTDWWCECQGFFGGRLCNETGPCYDSPCKQDSSVSCSQSTDLKNYTCECKDGWTGKNCTDDINECATNTSKCKYGLCNNTNGSYLCSCLVGYTGQYCEHEINECQPNPCQNNGACTDEINSFTCNCSGTGFKGATCSDDIDECNVTSAICNYGNCVNLPGSFRCDCTEMYLGSYCNASNPCYNNTMCNNNGKCQYNFTQNQGYVSSCICVNGYEGATCEKGPSADSGPDLGVIIGPIVGGVVLIIIVIVIIAFVLTARSKRATRGAYSPSQQETSGSRVELGNVLKKPPEERLI